jgi:hypothetical protein
MLYLGYDHILQDILYQIAKLKLTNTDFKSKSDNLNHDNPFLPTM